MNRFSALVVISLFFAGWISSANAQTTQLSGKVTASDDGQPLPGVTILVQDTTNIGTTTGAEGNYSLTVPADKNILVFSYVGFKRKEVTIGKQTVINVQLEQNIQQLDDLVVVGYGSQIKKEITGSVSNVSAEDIENTTANSVEQTLQGRSSGVGHDEKPTGGMLERFDDLKKLYDGLMNEYETLMDEDLKSFNESLESENIEHIVITPAN